MYLKKKYRSDSYSKAILQIAPHFLCICGKEGGGVVAALINLSIRLKVSISRDCIQELCTRNTSTMSMTMTTNHDCVSSLW